MNSYEPLTIQCQGGLLDALAAASETMVAHRQQYSSRMLYFLQSAKAMTGDEGTDWEIIYNVGVQQAAGHESAQGTFHG